MRKYLQTPGLLSVSLKTALSFSLAFILMLFSASALEAGSDEALITDTLRQTGITEPIQLSQWGDTAACFAETDGVKRLILLERHDGAWQIEIDNPTALIQVDLHPVGYGNRALSQQPGNRRNLGTSGSVYREQRVR